MLIVLVHSTQVTCADLNVKLLIWMSAK